MLTQDNQFNQTPFRANDPMAVGFMSQGQMGYMPHQQYLTPSEYGAFRTMPQNNNVYMPYQRPGFFQNMAYANGGYLGGIPLPTYNPSANIMHRQAMARRNLQDTWTAWGGAGLDAAVGFGMTALGGPLGLAASMMMPSIGGYAADVQGNMRSIQNMSMPKIVSGPDMSQGMGMGFSGHKALSIEKFIRSSAAGDTFLKSDDYRAIMQKGMENNLFDFSNSADGYKKIIKRLRNQMDVVMEVLDDKNLDSVMKNLKRIQDMGASGDISGSVMRQEGMFARMSGMRHSDMVNSYGQQGALIFSQQGLTGYQGSLSSMAIAAQLAMTQRMGLISPGELSRHGGMSGLTQKINESTGGGLQKTSNLYLPFFAGKDFNGIDHTKLSDFMSGKTDIDTMMKLGAERIKDPTEMVKYTTNADKLKQSLQDDLGPNGLLLFQAMYAKQAGRKMGITDPLQGMAAGLTSVFGFEQEPARIMAQNFTSEDFLKNLQDQEKRNLQGIFMKGAEKRKEEDFYSWRTAITESIEKISNPFFDWKATQEEKKEQRDARESGMYGGNMPGSSGAKGFSNAITKHGRGTTNVKDLDLTDITSVSARFESGNSGVAAIGWDKSGGTSYGSHQIASFNMDEFMKFAAENGGEDLAEFMKDSGPWDTGGTGGVAPEKYMEYASKNQEKLAKLEKAYIAKTHFDPLMDKIKEKNPELYEMISKNPALQAMAYSTSVQHGGALGILTKSFKEGMNSEEYIRSMYNYRADYVGNLSDKKVSSKDKRSIINNRIPAELEHVLALNALHEGKDPQSEVNANFEFSNLAQITMDRVLERVDDESLLSSMDLSNSFTTNKQMRKDVSSAAKMRDADYTKALETIGVTKGQFNLKVGDITKGVSIGSLSKEHEREILRGLGKSDEEIEVLLANPEVRRAIQKQYGAQNSDQLQLANDFVRAIEDKKLKVKYANLDDVVNEFKGEVSDHVGGRENAEKLISLNKANANTFSITELQVLIDNYNRSPSDFNKEKVYLLARKLGIKDEKTAQLLEEGDITSASIDGLKKEDLETIRDISRESSGSVPLSKFTDISASITATEGILAGESLLDQLGIDTASYDTMEELDGLIQSTKDPRALEYFKKLRAGGEGGLKNEAFRKKSLAEAMGSEVRTLDADGTPVAGDNKSAETSKSTIEALTTLMNNNSDSVSKNTTELEKLNVILSGGKKKDLQEGVNKLDHYQGP